MESHVPNDIQQTPLPGLLRLRAGVTPDKKFVWFDGQGLSYREADISSRAAASFLLRNGVGRGDRVGIMLHNGPDFIACWFGICRIGAIEVPLNISLRGAHLRHVLADSGMGTLIVARRFLTVLKEIDLPDALTTIVMVEHDGDDAAVPEFRGRKVYRFCDVLAEPAGGLKDAALTIADPAAIIYTSGTTGPSKGVICPHGHLLGLAIDTIETLEIGPRDVIYDAHPLYHAHSQTQAVMAAMMADVPVYMRRTFSASGFIRDIAEYGVTTAFLIGAAGLVLKQPPNELDRAHKLRLICAVPIPKDHKQPLEERFGVPVLDLYGMSEMGVISCNPLRAPVEGSCGVPTRRREVRIVDELDRPVPPGTVGEIVVRPRAPWSTFMGYWRMPEKTVEAFANLWFHTGDKGRMDEAGYLHFAGRIKDSIRRRGENVSAFEVEQVVNAHEGVLESAVLPYPSPVGEDDIWVVVVRRPGTSLEAAELAAYCEHHLPRYAVPRYVQFVESFPKTPTERIEKYKLQTAGLASDVFDREAAAAASR
ncbi:MAG: ATP-dependent acyl-CoA ligase [Alphaproteobacteria bacterium]|nr:MAG: ATP-dependent acyl-CoA ligase [Alphaproteobacteria bacterium]